MQRFHRSIVRIASLATLFAAAAAHAGSADFVDLRRIGPLVGDANAGKTKAAVCNACHGASGVAPASMFPNLAGQRAEYLYWQLVEFQREARPESPMTSQVAHLDDATLRDLAAYFASLPAPAPAQHEAPTSSRGAALYREGDRASGTPPCQGCHGAEGEGHAWADGDAAYRTYPRLRPARGLRGAAPQGFPRPQAPVVEQRPDHDARCADARRCRRRPCGRRPWRRCRDRQPGAN